MSAEFTAPASACESVQPTSTFRAVTALDLMDVTRTGFRDVLNESCPATPP